MKLSQLLAAAGLSRTQDTEITHITCDSRQVEPGALFAALEGSGADGRTFIQDAIAHGAAAVICRGGGEGSVPVIDVPNPRQALALMAAKFYGDPAKCMTIVAVTGTKGKSTTAHMLWEIFMAAGHKTGMIGTLGAFSVRNKIWEAVNTTPEPVTLHRLLRQMADDGCTHVVMEVSSQAVKLERIAGMRFAAAIFLNLSPDHIGPGEHENFWEYRHCKAELFSRCKLAVGNAADSAWPSMTAHIPLGVPVCTFGPCVTKPGPGLTTLLDTGEGRDYRIPMPGAFNGENAMAAIVTARAMDIPDGAIRAGLAKTRVPGRCMVYPAGEDYDVLIDYAHNGASFRALFSALRKRNPNHIIAVFGAGGDRPPMRRRDLARAAARGADYAVITEDNPRSEPVAEICAQISAAMPDLPHAVILDRREAIRYALDIAEPGDIVALLGKGHEEYIETNGVRRHFSEWDVLDEYFGR